MASTPSTTPPNNSSSTPSSSAPPPPLSSSTSSSSIAPKILLSKPISSPTDSTTAAVLRSRLPHPQSLTLLSDSWDIYTDRILPFLTENTDFIVVGVIGACGVGKSTILNEIYGLDGSFPGMLPRFVTQTEETKMMARHCTVGVELRVSAERLILLDTQPIFSPSVLSEMMRPDGLSTVSLYGDTLPAELAHELMGIQLAIFLASICHVLVVVTEGVNDTDMWHLMLTVDLLKHGIPDPSSLSPSYSQTPNLGLEKDSRNVLLSANEEYLACPVFVHTKMQNRDLAPHKVEYLKKTLKQYFGGSSFTGTKYGSTPKDKALSVRNPDIKSDESESTELDLFWIPYKNQDDAQGVKCESYTNAFAKLRDKVLSMNNKTFAKTVSERDWLRNSGRIWEMVKNSQVIAEYSRSLQGDLSYRR